MFFKTNLFLLRRKWINKRALITVKHRSLVITNGSKWSLVYVKGSIRKIITNIVVENILFFLLKLNFNSFFLYLMKVFYSLISQPLFIAIKVKKLRVPNYKFGI